MLLFISQEYFTLAGVLVNCSNKNESSQKHGQRIHSSYTAEKVSSWRFPILISPTVPIPSPHPPTHPPSSRPIAVLCCKFCLCPLSISLLVAHLKQKPLHAAVQSMRLAWSRRRHRLAHTSCTHELN